MIPLDPSANFKKLEEVTKAVNKFNSVRAQIEKVCAKHGFESYQDFLSQVAAISGIEKVESSPTQSTNATKKVIKEKKTKKRSRFNMTPEICETIKQQLAEGKSDADIMKNLKVPEATYERYKKKNFVHSGLKPGRPVTKPKPVPAPAAVDSAAPSAATTG
jgi:hypothetical protein